MFGLAGCAGDDDEEGTTSENDGVLDCDESAGPPAACCDIMQSVLDACIRCDVGSPGLCEYAVETQLQVSSFGSGCAGADEVRDQTELYEQCLPAMSTLDCADFNAGIVPTSCEDQIRYRLN